MAKQRKVLPARKQDDHSRDDESLLMRSAESLGRMIGTLQRQLDGATRRLSESADDTVESVRDAGVGGGAGSRRAGTRKTKKTARSAASGTTTRASARRPTQRRTRSGAKKAAKKR